MLPPRSPSPMPAPLPPPMRRAASPAPPASSAAAPVSVPWRRILPILLFRIADAITYVCIFPFVADMITSFDAPKERIGLYAGIAEGALMLTEAACATTWARLADRYGRRPVLLYGFAGSLGAAVMIGFAQSVPALIFWRAVFGLNPSGVLVKLIAGEISTPANRAKIFSVFSPSFSVGIMLGTLGGGVLAHPYGRLPAFLGGQSDFWRRWPYALPCVVGAGFGAVAALVSFFTLEERHNEHDSEKRAPRQSVSAIMRVPNFMLVLLVFCLFQIVTFAFDGLWTVFTYTSVPQGGLGLPVTLIGVLYSFAALMYVSSAPFVIPRLQARYGTVRTLGFIFMAWPALALSIPVAQWLAAHVRPLMWLTIWAQLATKNFGNYAWPMCDILTLSLFDDYPEMLATGNAIMLIAGAGGRAVGPTVSGWIYSISTTFPTGSLGRQVSWLSLLLVAVPPVVLVRLLSLDMAKDRPRAGDEYEAVPLRDADDDALVMSTGDTDLRGDARARHVETV